MDDKSNGNGQNQPKDEKQRPYLYITTICILIVSFILAILADFSIIQPPHFILINPSERQNLLSTLFTVQASISVASIAIPSIISGLYDKTIYGVPLTLYVTTLKRKIFSHRVLIIICISSILLNYFIIAKDFYNISIFLFFLNLIISMVLVTDSYFSLKGKYTIENKIEAYIKNNYRDEMLTNLGKYISDMIVTKNMLEIKSNIDFMLELFKSLLDDKKATDKQKICNNFSEVLSNVYNQAFELKYYEAYNYIINEKIKEFYEAVNKHNDEKHSILHLDIWNKIEINFFRMIGISTYEDLDLTNNYYFNLHEEILKNPFYENNYKTENERIKDFSQNMFYYIYFKNNNITYSETKNQCIDCIFNRAIKCINSEKDIPILREECCLLIKKLIDYRLYNNIKKFQTPNKSDIYKKTDENTNHYNYEKYKYHNFSFVYIIIVFLFALSNHKNDYKRLDFDIKKTLSDLFIDKLNYDLSNDFFIDFLNKDYKYIYSCLHSLKFSFISNNEFGKKCSTYEETILDFSIFIALVYCLEKYSTKDEQKNFITVILDIYVSVIYEKNYKNLCGSKYTKEKEKDFNDFKEGTLQTYYIDVFLDGKNTEEITELYNILKSIIQEKVKSLKDADLQTS